MLYYVWLQCVLGAGSNKLKELLKHFGTAENVFKASKSDIKNSEILTKTQLEKISNIKLDKAQEIIEKCKALNIKIITVADKRYPKMLKDIQNPPAVLYYVGEFPCFDSEPSVCIVGPRNVSDYGKKAAFSLSSRLSRAGMLIISGGALGTDTYAHKGVLKYGGKTVLIMGCGINYRYLPENEKMRSLILKFGGCIISEYPPDTPAFASNFPVRNRLMSALSLATVVIEAKQKSGSLITANMAAEQGKEVFVIPGTPGREEYSGSNLLLRDGAIPLIDAKDILNEYISRFEDKIDIERAYKQEKLPEKKKENVNIEKISNISLSKEAKIVYNQLDRVEFFADDLLSLGLSADEILSALTELEIEGVIRACPGGKYTVL